MRLVYLIGAPGVGKTTLTQELVRPWGDPVWVEFPLKHLRWGDRHLLGWPRRTGFGGTDSWSMSAGPKAVKWLSGLGPHDYVLGEGDRLAVEEWLRQLKATVVWLTLDAPTLAVRRAGRTQNETWVKGRETKVRRLAEALGSTMVDASASPQALAMLLRQLGLVP